MSSGGWDDRVWEEQSFRFLIDELPDLVCRYLPDGTLLYANRAYAAFHGGDAEALIGKNLLDLVPADLRPVVAATLAELQHITPEKPVKSNEHADRNAAGEVSWYEWTDKAFFAPDGTLMGFMAVGRDVTQRKDAEARASHLALHDPLTGLWNRRGLLAHLEDRLEMLSSHPAQGVAVLYLDLNDFKRINDDHGHRAGDECLVQTARALQSTLRGGDLVGRMGGDEFLMICAGVQDEAALFKLRARVERTLAGLTPAVTASVGHVIAHVDQSADDILHRADQAMYAEKRRGASARGGRARSGVGDLPANLDLHISSMAH